MKIVYMGTPDFAVPSLKRLIESDHEIVCVVTQPDRPAGRGQKLTPPPVKNVALEAGLPVLQPAKIKGTDFHVTLADFHPDVIAVAAYGKILPPEVLGAPRYGCVNVHASLLPKYRGAAPVNWAIVEGERETGVTIMHMDEGMDTGGIIAQESIQILDDDDALSVTNMLSVLGADLLVRELERIEQQKKITSEPQDDSQATYAPLLKKADGRIDWTMTSEKIICRMHGLRPWPGCFSKVGDVMLRLNDADRLTPEEFVALENPEHKPGQVVDVIRTRGPVVRTGDGYLVVTDAQPPNRKAMKGPDLINGNHLVPPMRFAPPGQD